MPARLVLIAAFALALSGCAWLPWSHRRPVRPATPPPAASTSAAARPLAVSTAAVPVVPKEPRPATAPRKRPLAAPAMTVGARAAPEKATPAVIETTARIRGNDLHGRLRLEAGRGQQLHAGETVDTVVYYLPDSGSAAPRPRRHDIVTAHRDFRPSAIAVPVGSTLSYVNKDNVRHNVFSVTPGAAFNLGYQPAGTRDDHVFGKAGLVLVNCNVHHTMEMDVLVVPSRYASRVAADGTFTLHGLPDGPGEIVAWNPRARLLRKPLSLPAKEPVALRLLAERPRVITEIDVAGRP